MGPGLLATLALLAERGDYERAGVALGAGERVIALFLAGNLLRSPTEFLADPLDIVAAYDLAENLGLEVVAMFHTHPAGDPVPSLRDVEGMRLWPMPWIVASPRGVRAWALSGGSVVEVPIEVAR